MSRLKRHKPDFKRQDFNYDEWFYDPEYDADLIEASFAAQYGIRLRQEPDITYAEYARMLSGLMADTPFGRIVNVRMEKDRKAIQKMTPHEKKIRSDWAKFKAKTTPQQTQQVSVEDMKNMFKGLVRQKGGG